MQLLSVYRQLHKKQHGHVNITDKCPVSVAANRRVTKSGGIWKVFSGLFCNSSNISLRIFCMQWVTSSWEVTRCTGCFHRSISFCECVAGEIQGVCFDSATFFGHLSVLTYTVVIIRCCLSITRRKVTRLLREELPPLVLTQVRVSTSNIGHIKITCLLLSVIFNLDLSVLTILRQSLEMSIFTCPIFNIQCAHFILRQIILNIRVRSHS
jgi:hypothetical protein